MIWRVQWRSRARADLAALDPPVRRRVLAAMARLADTNQGDMTKLRGGNRDEWRLRVGNWRVILTFDYPNNTFTVMRVQHRREVYRRR